MSQLRHVELADECESIKTNTMYWPGWWRAIEPAQEHVAGSIFAELFFSAKKIEPATRRWASYEAVSQLPSIEPGTWHWASYVALSQQGSFELARRQWAQWASKVALSFIIYIPMQSQPYNILNLGQNNFFWGRHVPLSWSGNVNNIRDMQWHEYWSGDAWFLHPNRASSMNQRCSAGAFPKGPLEKDSKRCYSWRFQNEMPL